jgi:hypothetical protein
MKEAGTSAAGERIRGIVDGAGESLQRLGDREAAEKPSAEKWSRKETLGHLVDSAANNHQRFVRALLEDGLEFPGYVQTRWVGAQAYAEESWDLLVKLWSAFNRHLAHVVSRIPPDRLGARCRIGGGAPVTLGFLINDYIRHVEHHLEQILP